MNIRVPPNLLKALEPYSGTARLVGPEMAFDSTLIQKGDPRRRLVGWTLVVALATTPASVAIIQEIGRTIQTAIEHDGISTVRIEVDGIKVQATGRQAGMKAAAALVDAYAERAKGQK